MVPLSTYYTQEVNKFIQDNLGTVVTQFQPSRLFGAAYAKVASMQNALSGVYKTGIYPRGPNVFSDADFTAAETTEWFYKKKMPP